MHAHIAAHNEPFESQAGSSAKDLSAIRSELRQLINAYGGCVKGCATMTTDGLIIAAVLSDNIDQDVFAAMNASLLVLADRASEEVDIGKLKQLMVMGTAGVMLLTQVGEDAVLAVAAEPGANLGKILLDTNKTARQLKLMT